MKKKMYVEYGRVELFSADEASLMEDSGMDQMRYVRIDGAAEITVYDKAGNALGSFSNQNGDSFEYTDFAYYYGYNNEDGEPYADVYLFNEAYSIQADGEEVYSVRVMQYDETESMLTGGTSIENAAVEDGGYLEIMTDGNSDVFFAVDGNGNRTEIETVTAFSYAEEVSLSESEATLECGESITLTAAPVPANSVLDGGWVSSDPLVASVEDGLVTAKKPGSSEIQYITGSGCTSVCTVTVLPAWIAASVKEGEIQYELEVDNTSGLTLVAAWYDTHGRMEGCKTLREFDVKGQISVPASDRYKLLLLDAESHKPICKAWDSK